jgi:L-seryl-tRNA(Ser) seleniumtransferase
MELKNIPSMTELLKSKEFLKIDLKQDILKKLINKKLKSIREKIQKDSKIDITKKDIRKEILSSIKELLNIDPKVVINGTGVILHTNLGRAPLSKVISKKIDILISNYTDLELDIKNKKRRTRTSKTSDLLELLTGSESSTVFNNGAMALVVCLGSFGKNKEILISRSESIEIGGGFRIPEIIKMSGQKTIDVGTTNKTYIKDYEDNITDKTVAILKVHKSNYKIEGFTSEVEIKELSKLGEKYNIPIIHDIGSGNFLNSQDFNLPYEPTIFESLRDGADITLFSGDKLLGGPQCGIIVGKKNYIENINKNPLARASRIDKLNLFILNLVLKDYLNKDSIKKIPSWEMIDLSKKELKKRAEKILQELPQKFYSIDNTSSTVGGGTFPETNIDSVAICMNDQKYIMSLENYLLNLEIPILGKVERQRLMLDLRTIFPEYDSYLIDNLNNFFNNDSI